MREKPQHWKLARYGSREIIISISLCVIGAGVSYFYLPWLLPLFALGFFFTLFFFRDPPRRIPGEEGILVAPADGRIVGMDEVFEGEFLKAGAKRVTIFLSLFDVHLNRAPCSGVVRLVMPRPGRFLSAIRREASEVNESNLIGIETQDGFGKVVVKQIAGVIARRIVCDAKPDDEIQRGQKLGMIKFGSRTELYVPLEAGVELIVCVGQKVKAGETIIGRKS